MSLSACFAIGCWGAVLLFVLFGLYRAVRDRRRDRPPEPEALDFRDWLEDWDQIWP